MGISDLESRRAYQRKRYADNVESERKRKKELTARHARDRAAGVPVVRKYSPYDAEDYVAEFSELTDLGLSCREIVERSVPSLSWFRENVFPVAPRALCISCRGFFVPAAISRGTECGTDCRNLYTGFGTRKSG